MSLVVLEFKTGGGGGKANERARESGGEYPFTASYQNI